jgi:hypothetical protein
MARGVEAKEIKHARRLSRRLGRQINSRPGPVAGSVAGALVGSVAGLMLESGMPYANVRFPYGAVHPL